MKVTREGDLTSPAGEVRAAPACRNGRQVLWAARERDHRRGGKTERRGAGRSKAGTDAAIGRPVEESANRAATDAHPAGEFSRRSEVDDHPASVAAVPGYPVPPAEEAAPVGQGDQGERDEQNGRPGRAPRDGRDG